MAATSLSLKLSIDQQCIRSAYTTPIEPSHRIPKRNVSLSNFHEIRAVTGPSA